jgi:hypothetical protein
MQHIRNYHHLEMEDEAAMAESRLKYVFPVCSHPSCPQYRDETFKRLPRKAQAENKPFGSQSAYTKHMREEHNECPFPCDIPGCTRVGRRGYFREKDLLNHRRQEHPDAPKYDVTTRELRILCTEPGCDSLLDPSSMRWHMFEHERKLKRKERERNKYAGILGASAAQQDVEELGPETFQAFTSQQMQSFDDLNLPDELKQQHAPFNF